MGFLIFAARKLQLKRKMNDLQFRNMQLSSEQQSISAQIANVQKTINAAKNQVNYVNSIMNAASVAGQALTGNQATQTQSTDINAISKQFGVNNMTNVFSNVGSTVSNTMNSIFDATSQVQLAQLNSKDSQISLELENNESQLTLITAEYQNVKKAESEEAKNCAPTFGLA